MLDSNKIKPVKSKFSATRAYGNNRYIVYSPKLGREVILYSNLEYYCFLLLEFDSEVSFYCEQPNLNISQNIEGKIKKSIVDFIKEDSAGITIIECKPTAELSKQEVMEQIHIQKEWATLQHISHEVFTEDMLKDKQVMLENLKSLHTALVQYSTAEHFGKESILLFLEENRKSSIHHLLNYCPNVSERTVLPILAQLLHEGKLRLAMTSSRIDFETEVRINDER
ncbi:TnsA endonuclease N-terminal domain-containing protein [Streptococcus gallolyticus]|uniref:TnsA endonuclease N-terminal domain-containing protein n=2 Tax=Streptococcus gallolyticus TaxID=315405 RepID=A0A139QKS2_9STRE|nr:TnsA endonuclease N-terminal domain-containing protein [Streptococcus gallolyticus]KXU03150.1 hypothetical protein SGADD03_02174 [Streptococcus gallolyticus]